MPEPSPGELPPTGTCTIKNDLCLEYVIVVSSRKNTHFLHDHLCFLFLLVLLFIMLLCYYFFICKYDRRAYDKK